MKKLFFVVLTLCVTAGAIASDAAYADTKRAVLVTGASSGIGKRIAETLASEGYFVYAGARKAKDIAALSALKNIEGIRLDVTRQDEINAAVKHIRNQGRGLYGLVNNAGVFLFDPLIEISESDLQFIIDVNVFGPYRVTKAFAPLIMESKGRITTTGSIASAYSARLFGPYSMSKSAMDSYTEALASEMRKFDVAVSIVQPGNFRSNIMSNMQRRIDEMNNGEASSMWQAEIEKLAAFTQTDRSHHADPKPVADAVVDFLESDKPKLRYMVTPNEREAQMTIRSSLKRVLELNQDQAFAMSRDELIAALDKLLAAQASQ